VSPLEKGENLFSAEKMLKKPLRKNASILRPEALMAVNSSFTD